MLLLTYYARNNAGIIGASLLGSNKSLHTIAGVLGRLSQGKLESNIVSEIEFVSSFSSFIDISVVVVLE